MLGARPTRARPACRLRNVSAAAALAQTMPRYFFNLTNGDTVADDDLGEEFAQAEAAQAHAMAVAWELSRHELPDALIGLYISVVDEHGLAVFKVPLYSGNG